MDEYAVFWYLAGIPLLGMLAQWLAWRLRIPAILLLLAFGMLLGLFVQPDQLLGTVMGTGPEAAPRLLLPIVSLCVAVILFEGGLTLKFSELRNSGTVTLRLVTLGALVTWLLGALAAYWLLQLRASLAVLLGAILVVTGPTVVMPLLRSIRPSRRIGSILKWEGIVIDPIGAVLAVLVFEHLATGAADTSGWTTLVQLLKTVSVGFIGGAVVSRLLTQALKRFWLPDFLHGAAFLTAVLFSFVASNWAQHESGLITVTVMGVLLANQKHIDIRHVLEFKEHLGVMLISFLFVVLASRLDLEALRQVGPRGLLFVGVLIFVVRPAAVFLATIRTGIPMSERIFLACLAPRGIVAASVASVFALHLIAHADHDVELARQAQMLVPVTFLVIVGTVAVYGLAAGPLARRLALADPSPQGLLIAGAEPWIQEFGRAIQEEGYAVLLVDTNYGNVTQARMSGLPADCCSILSEHVRDELDLSGIGRMLAMTPNDEINTLAVREFIHVFGRAGVYQLAPPYEATGPRVPIAEHLRGRQLFGAEIHQRALARRLNSGSVIKKTLLTESYGYEQFVDRYGDSGWVLGLIESDGDLLIASLDQPLEPAPGQTVIALVDEREVARA